MTDEGNKLFLYNQHTKRPSRRPLVFVLFALDTYGIYKRIKHKRMKLYHYTTIDCLAQILRNHTLRFNRLDRVDDIEEGAISPSGVRIGQYVFVSCWTKDSEESIPLWKMYTANGRGVRICLESKMFRCYDNSEIVNCDGIRFSLKGTAYERTLTPISDFVNKDYMVLPVNEMELDYILKDIQYVDDVPSAVSNSVFFQQITNNYKRVNVNTRNLGLFKHKRWAFEKESRFVLFILPGHHFEKMQTFGPDLSQWMLDVMSNNIPGTISYYDLHLKEDIFDSLEVVLGPSCVESDRIIVDALCSKYAPKSVITSSALTESLRMK